MDEHAESEVEEVEPVDPTDVDAYEVESSGFDSCTGDCSGHEAGAAWAQENDLADPSECGGNSDSFVAGCEAFTEDRISLADQQTQDAQDAADDAALEEEDMEEDSAQY